MGDPVEWCVEVKMTRFRGDNGKPDNTSLKDVLSPYDSDRSALTDTVRLAHSRLPGSKAILIYGFDYPDRRLDPASTPSRRSPASTSRSALGMRWRLERLCIPSSRRPSLRLEGDVTTDPLHLIIHPETTWSREGVLA